MKSTLQQHGELLEELALLLQQEAARADPGWLELFLDLRLDSPESGLDRTVIRTPHGRKGIVPSIEVSQFQDELMDIRSKIPGGEWYGLLIHINHAGNVDVKYDHNPHCIDSFIDDEKARRPF